MNSLSLPLSFLSLCEACVKLDLAIRGGFLGSSQIFFLLLGVSYIGVLQVLEAKDFTVASGQTGHIGATPTEKKYHQMQMRNLQSPSFLYVYLNPLVKLPSTALAIKQFTASITRMKMYEE